MSSELTKDRAIELIIIKDQRGLSYFYDRYSPALNGIILRIVGSHELSEEILQDTFMKIWMKMDQYDAEKSSIFSWMAKIARNTAIDRKRLKGYEHLKNSVTLDPKIHSSAYTEDHSKLDVAYITKSLAPKYKEVLDCIYLQGYTHQDACQQMNLPIGTVKTRLRKSISILRSSLRGDFHNSNTTLTLST